MSLPPSGESVAVRDFGLNDRAWGLIEALRNNTAELRIAITRHPSGAQVLDAGISVRGGIGAGLALATVCMGGLGHVSINEVGVGEHSLPGVHVWTDHPSVACIGSQYAGWSIKTTDYFAMGSGPLRAHARVERELFERLHYSEDAAHGVLVLEAHKMPTPAAIDLIAERARMSPEQLVLAVAPTASLAGGLQVVARVVETGLHKMESLGFDITRVVSAIGSAPLPPVAKDDLRAIGRTNDCVLYGGRAHYHVDADDDTLRDLAGRVPSMSSLAHGRPFHEVFSQAGGDFYAIDPLLFSPAEVWLTSVVSGQTFHGGRTEPAILLSSLHNS